MAAVDANVAEGMRRMGASDEQIAQACAERPEAASEEQGLCWVDEDNWESWQFFLRVQFQWVCAGMDCTRLQLNWVGIAAWAAMARIGTRRLARHVPALELIERAVLQEDNRMAAQRASSRKGRA